MWRATWAPAFMVVVAFCPTAAVAQELDAKTITAKDLEPQSDWYGLYLNGKKMGYCRTSRDKADGGVRESFTLVMKLVSFGQKAELSMTQSLVFESKPPYRLLKGSFQQNEDGKAKIRMRLERAGDGFTVTHEAGGVTKTKDHGDIDYTFLDSTATERWVRRNPKPGDELAAKDFNMQELKLEPQTNKVKDQKTSLAGGVKVKYYEIETESRQLIMLSRYDDQGRMLSGKFAIFDIRLEPEELAKNAQFSQDLFVLGMVKIDRPLGLTKNLSELVVEVAGLEGAAFDDGPRQTFVPAKGSDAALLKVGKKYGKTAKLSAKEIEDNLQETLTYPISHPKIKELADEAVGDAKSPREKVKRIVDFVHDYVEPSLSASLPNIHDLMQRKKGDCKSYALLTTTLARAAGVPSREVSGLLYIGDDNKAFGGHAWNEVVLDGVWVPVDSSLGETEVDAGHISFGPQDRGAKGLLETLGKLSFKLVEVKTGQ